MLKIESDIISTHGRYTTVFMDISVHKYCGEYNNQIQSIVHLTSDVEYYRNLKLFSLFHCICFSFSFVFFAFTNNSYTFMATVKLQSFAAIVVYVICYVLFLYLVGHIVTNRQSDKISLVNT